MTTFTTSSKFGIGEIIEETESHVVVYFEDEDVEKKLIKKFITIFESYEDAENSINDVEEEEEEVMSEEDYKAAIERLRVITERDTKRQMSFL